MKYTDDELRSSFISQINEAKLPRERLQNAFELLSEYVDRFFAFVRKEDARLVETMSGALWTVIKIAGHELLKVAKEYEGVENGPTSKQAQSFASLIEYYDNNRSDLVNASEIEHVFRNELSLLVNSIAE